MLNFATKTVMPDYNCLMNPSHIRQILLAKAIESLPQAERLISAEQQQAATNNALYALRAQESASRKNPIAKQRYLFDLFRARANMIVAELQQQSPQLGHLLATERHWLSRVLTLALPLLAFIMGFTLDRIADPHQINLLSQPLLAILIWNLLVYGLCLALPVSRKIMDKRKKMPNARPLWAKLWMFFNPIMMKGRKNERRVIQQFTSEWLHLSQPLILARIACCLHLCAAALALGLLCSLWITGLSTQYRVGWESTLLNAAQVKIVLDILSWPAHTLLGTNYWTLQEIQALQSWPEAINVQGLKWLQIYSALLLSFIVLPRIVLATWSLIVEQYRSKRLKLPLSDPYFRSLIKDFNSDAIALFIQPYSFELTEERIRQLNEFVNERFGKAAHCHFLTMQTYADKLNKHELDTATGNDTADADTGVTSYVFLVNLAATPEHEAHGQAIEQWLEYQSQKLEVWVYCIDFAQRYASDADGKMRIAERKRAWAHFLQTYALTPVFIES